MQFLVRLCGIIFLILAMPPTVYARYVYTVQGKKHRYF